MLIVDRAWRSPSKQTATAPDDRVRLRLSSSPLFNVAQGAPPSSCRSIDVVVTERHYSTYAIVGVMPTRSYISISRYIRPTCRLCDQRLDMVIVMATPALCWITSGNERIVVREDWKGVDHLLHAVSSADHRDATNAIAGWRSLNLVTLLLTYHPDRNCGMAASVAAMFTTRSICRRPPLEEHYARQ